MQKKPQDLADELEPIKISMKCRDGPISDRSCSVDIFCIFAYLGLIAFVVFFGLSTKQPQVTEEQFEKAFSESVSHPIMSLYKTRSLMLLCLIVTIILSLLMLLPTAITWIFRKIYVRIFFMLTLFLAVIFILVNLNIPIPFIYEYLKQGKFGNIIMAFILIVAFFVSLYIVRQNQQKLRRMQLLLSISQKILFECWWIFLISVLLSFLSLVAFNLNINLIWKTQNPENQFLISNQSMLFILVIETLITHGFIQSLSIFIVESVTTHWYFNQAKNNYNYDKIDNLLSTFRLIFFSLGTIIYGFVFVLVPEFLITIFKYVSKKWGCFKGCGQLHLSKFCFICNIIQSLSFFQANLETEKLTKKAQLFLPEIYMLGGLYMELSNIFTLIITLCIFYILLIQQYGMIFSNLFNLVLPLFTMILLSMEVTHHFMNVSAVVGDTITLLYTFDYELERLNYYEITAYSCPYSIKQIVNNIRFVGVDEEED